MNFPETWADFIEYIREMLADPSNKWAFDIVSEPSEAQPWYTAHITRDQNVDDGGGRFHSVHRETDVQFTGWDVGTDTTIRFRIPEECRMLVRVVVKGCTDLGIPVPDPPIRVPEIDRVDPATGDKIVEKLDPDTGETTEILIYDADTGNLQETITIDPDSGSVTRLETFDPATGEQLSDVEDPPVESPGSESR